MKISDIMQGSVIKVAPSDPTKDVARIIFSLGISGVPVVDGRKLVGIVTEEDIFQKIEPTLTKITNGNSTNENTQKVMKVDLNTPVKEIMSKNVVSVSKDDPIMKAQTVMLINHFSRLPVLNNKGELVGIVTQGDIFKEVLKKEIPAIEKERYANFIAENYDSSVNWDERLPLEFPALFEVFKKNKIENLLDVGSWTGQYAIELINHGVKKILAVDHNPSMIDLSKNKLKRLNAEKAKRLEFLLTDFANLDRIAKGPFDGALASGNSLVFLPIHIDTLFPKIAKTLRKKDAVMIIQALNFDKVLNGNRLLSFGMSKPKNPDESEHIYIEFLDKKEKNGILTQHVVIFENDKKGWTLKSITSIPVFHYRKEDFEVALKASGFTKITITGNDGKYALMSSKSPFKPKSSDWMNIVAIRK